MGDPFSLPYLTVSLKPDISNMANDESKNSGIGGRGGPQYQPYMVTLRSSLSVITPYRVYSWILGIICGILVAEDMVFFDVVL